MSCPEFSIFSKVASHCVLILCFPNSNALVYFSLSSEKCLFTAFAHFLLCCLFFFLCFNKSFLYSLDTDLLPVTDVPNIFSQSMACLFTSFLMSLTKRAKVLLVVRAFLWSWRRNSLALSQKDTSCIFFEKF